MRTDLFARAACEARERRPCLSEVRPAAASIGRVPVDSACPCPLVLSRATRKRSLGRSGEMRAKARWSIC